MIGVKYQTLLDEISRHAAECGRNPAEITLVAISKTQSEKAINEAYAAGCRDMGESRVQEFLNKKPGCPSDLRWHFIGTLQANKVKKIIGLPFLIHSVDTPELAQKIPACSVESGVRTSVLLQVNVSGELTKRGLSIQEWRSQVARVVELPNIEVQGLMTMAPLTPDSQVIRDCFRRLREFRDQLGLVHLSMGMSHDYLIAIEEGATLLRIGSAVFDMPNMD